MLSTVLVVAYAVVAAMLCVYGLHRTAQLRWYLRHKPVGAGTLPEWDELPKVTVQLPVYNEKHVIERLIRACAAFEYPTDKLHIQVLDDSTDETSAIAQSIVAELRATGLNIDHVRRQSRVGFKAGALAEGLRQAQGAFIAIFDADFVPNPDFLRRTIGVFCEPDVGMVQVRWEHLNRDESLLTRIQAVMLDGHFVIESTARFWSGRFFNFNGTAGVWRRTCIEDAGGWEHDTLTEDLDLSYRAQLAGWRFVYMPDVTAPAELPADINAFKSQQYRWAKGSLQTACKLLPRILWGDLPLRVRFESFLHLTNNIAYLCTLIMVLMVGPVLLVHGLNVWWFIVFVEIPVFLMATVSVCSYFGFAQWESGARTWDRFAVLPAVLAAGCGMALNTSLAVLEGLFVRGGEFVRTPKRGSVTSRVASYRPSRSVLPRLELAIAAYLVVCAFFAWREGWYLSLPFLTLFIVGYGFVGITSLQSRR